MPARARQPTLVPARAPGGCLRGGEVGGRCASRRTGAEQQGCTARPPPPAPQRTHVPPLLSSESGQPGGHLASPLENFRQLAALADLRESEGRGGGVRQCTVHSTPPASGAPPPAPSMASPAPAAGCGACGTAASRALQQTAAGRPAAAAARCRPRAARTAPARRRWRRRERQLQERRALQARHRPGMMRRRLQLRWAPALQGTPPSRLELDGNRSPEASSARKQDGRPRGQRHNSWNG